MPVRFATIADEDAIFDLLVEMHRESPLARRIPYDRETVYRTIRLATRPDQRRPSGFIGIIDAPDGDGLAATCGIDLVRWWWAADCYYLYPVWTFVRPRWRRGYKFDEMLCDWMGECRIRMADDIIAGGDRRPFLLETSFVALDRVEAKSRLWRRLWRRWGVKKIGEIFIIGL